MRTFYAPEYKMTGPRLPNAYTIDSLIQYIQRDIAVFPDWKYSVEAGRETTDGTPTFSTDSTSYGFERKHAGFSLEGAIAPGLTAVLRANQAWGENELDPSTGNND